MFGLGLWYSFVKVKHHALRNLDGRPFFALQLLKTMVKMVTAWFINFCFLTLLIVKTDVIIIIIIFTKFLSLLHNFTVKAYDSLVKWLGYRLFDKMITSSNPV